MAYEVTATRKRPQDFEKLVGQEFVVSTLENAIKDGRIAHAYLFSGPRGVGKTSSARLLAKALNCQNGPSAHPCGECTSCREITAGSSIDVIEIDGASNTSVNDIRAIKEEILFPPQSSRYKIYIIDEVHMLSTSAFNALLKTIEEPPEYIIFIFATTELQKVPATIRSRCQQFKFQLISQELIARQLEEAAADLNIKADKDALFWISKEATGSMRDAYTLFDQVASFSEDHITLDKIKSRLSIAGFNEIKAIVSEALSKNSETTFAHLDSLFASGISAEQIVKESAEFFRTILLYKNGVRRTDLLGESEEDIPKQLIDSLTKEQIEAALRAFIELYRDLRYTLSPRMEIELIYSRLSSLPSLVSPSSLFKKLENLKNGIAEGRVVVKTRLEDRVITATTQDRVTDSERIKYSKEEKAVEATNPPAIRPERKEIIPIDLTLKDRLIEALNGLNYQDTAKKLSGISEIRAKEDGTIALAFNKSMAYSSCVEKKNEISAALYALFKENRAFELIKVVNENTKARECSERMTALKAVFGGAVKFNEVATVEKKEERKLEEIKVNELQPIRFDEADGNDRSPDEDD